MPDTIFEHWKPASLFSRLNSPYVLKTWLLEQGSLTARLRSIYPKLEVKVLSENWQIPLKDESSLLRLPYDRQAWIRSVLLHCGEQELVYARTVIPDCFPGNPWFRLKKLGNQPLGEVLFQLKGIERGPFELTEIPRTSWPHLPEKINAQQKSFARRSIFIQQNKPLLLTEAFLTAPQT